jgi:hypothetical protein
MVRGAKIACTVSVLDACCRARDLRFSYPRDQHTPVVNTHACNTEPRRQSHADKDKRHSTSCYVNRGEVRAAIVIWVTWHWAHCSHVESNELSRVRSMQKDRVPLVLFNTTSEYCIKGERSPLHMNLQDSGSACARLGTITYARVVGGHESRWPITNVFQECDDCPRHVTRNKLTQCRYRGLGFTVRAQLGRVATKTGSALRRPWLKFLEGALVP